MTESPARPPACYVARWEEEATLPLAQWGVLSLSRALVGSLYIKINIPTYSRRLPLTEKARVRRGYGEGTAMQRWYETQEAKRRQRGGGEAAAMMATGERPCEMKRGEARRDTT